VFASVTPYVTENLNQVISKQLGANASLNPKGEFKNEVRIPNHNEINPNSSLTRNSKL
jgi:hypothetical protein